MTGSSPPEQPGKGDKSPGSFRTVHLMPHLSGRIAYALDESSAVAHWKSKMSGIEFKSFSFRVQPFKAVKGFREREGSSLFPISILIP